MTRYLLSVIHPEGQPSIHDDVDIDEIFAAVDRLNERLVAEDRMVFGGGLEAPSTAVTVRPNAENTETMVTDGPHVELKEALGGFWVLRAEPDEIDAIAREAALACRTTIEVRAFHPEPDDA